MNVSDLLDINLDAKFTTAKIQTFWFPLGESFGFPLENIFAAMKFFQYIKSLGKSFRMSI